MLTIRRATPCDIDLIRRLAAEVFPATYRTLLTPEQLEYMLDWMYSAASIRREMEEGFAWFVAEWSDEVPGNAPRSGKADADCRSTDAALAAPAIPCGYLSIQRETDDLFHLQKIYLLSAFQGTGAGRQLFAQAVDYIHTIHPAPCRMELNVNRENPALGFYERMGMQRLRQGDFPIGNGYYMCDYIMGLEIG